VFESIVYVMCFLTSGLCTGLLLNAYYRHRQPLLFWSAVCFGLLAVNNLLVFIDIVLLPHMDLLPLRMAANFAAVGVLLYGFIWELD
jgi:hypothetical protein